MFLALLSVCDSGTHCADAKWYLTCGNRKPEGIADPPPPGTLLPTAAWLPAAFENRLVEWTGARDSSAETWSASTAPRASLSPSFVSPAPSATLTERVFAAIDEESRDTDNLGGATSLDDFDWLDTSVGDTDMAVEFDKVLAELT